MNIRHLLIALAVASLCSCAPREYSLTVVAPGHFHASLVQKTPLEGVSEKVKVFAPEGPELQNYLAAIEGFNSRADNPTSWVEDVYAGPDFLERMPVCRDGHGIVVLAGDNAQKSGYILEAVRKGYNVLSDKPLAISAEGFEQLKEAYRLADRKGLVVLDLMTERYDTLNIIARRLIADRDKFGEPVSATMTSVHHFCKLVAGKPTTRPEWYYDVTRQGEGIADVTTHLIDILLWQCFPGQAVREAEVLEASHYATRISPEQFALSTGGIIDDPLDVYSNGCIKFAVNGLVATMNVRWDFVAPEGSGDTYEAQIVGTNGTVGFVQDASTGYVRELYFQPLNGEREWYSVPVAERLSHEEHFHCVAQSFLKYVKGEASVPEWEEANTITKYYITTTAVQMAAE